MKQNLLSSVWKCWVLTLFISSHCLSSFSQFYGERSSFFEGGITVGPMNLLGDLGGTAGIGRKFIKDNNFQMTKVSFGAWLSYQPSEWLGFRLGLNIGTLEGDDAVIKSKGGFEGARKLRNSNVKTPLQEAFLVAEVYPTVFLEYDPTDVFQKIRPYGLLGVGVFRFRPQGTDPLTGNWVDLQPLRTEGQGFPEYPDRQPYKLTQLNVPMGIGVKYFLNETMHIGLEVIHRTTFTDYIDDVSTTYIDPALFYAHLPASQAAMAERLANKSLAPSSAFYQAGAKRGTPENNDAYYSFCLKVGWRLGSDNRWNNSTRCPVRF